VGKRLSNWIITMSEADLVYGLKILFTAWCIGWGAGFGYITIKKGIEKLL